MNKDREHLSMNAFALFDSQRIIVGDNQLFYVCLDVSWVCRYYQQMQGMNLILNGCLSRQLKMSYSNLSYGLRSDFEIRLWFLFALCSFSLLNCTRSSYNMFTSCLSDQRPL